MLRRVVVAVALLAVIALSMHLARSFWFVCDDAWISFRYALNWARGHGVRYNLGDHVPVEGYSNFLWVAIAAVVERLRGDVSWWMPTLSLASGAVFTLVAYLVARVRFGMVEPVALWVAAALALSPGFVVWCTGGLATMPAALLLFVTFDQLLLATDRRAWLGAAVAGLALLLIRTEGVAWVVVMTIMAAFVRWREPDRHPDPWRDLGRFVGVVAVGWSLYAAWRYATYESLISNTARAKVGVSTEVIARGWEYVFGFWLAALAPAVHLLGAAWAWSRARWVGLCVAAMALGAPAYAMVVGGDFMTMGRLLVPSLVFGALLMGLMLQAAWDRSTVLGGVALAAAFGLTVIGTLPLDDQHLVPEDVRRSFRVRFNTHDFRSEREQWRFMKSNTAAWHSSGRYFAAMAEPGESVVRGAIGAFGYRAADAFIYDRYGLVNRRVADNDRELDGDAHSPGHDKAVRPEFFLRDEPTYLKMEMIDSRDRLDAARKTGRKWVSEDRIARRYAPHIDKVKLKGRVRYILTLKRSDDPARDADAFDKRIGQLKGDRD